MAKKKPLVVIPQEIKDENGKLIAYALPYSVYLRIKEKIETLTAENKIERKKLNAKRKLEAKQAAAKEKTKAQKKTAAKKAPKTPVKK
jgi:hypothetical protein